MKTYSGAVGAVAHSSGPLCAFRTTRFDPRSRVGSDHLTARAVGDAVGVSIRAPAWGATIHGRPKSRHAGVSIRAPAWGATFAARAGAVPDPFRSALPRGERRWIRADQAMSYCFDPRSRVGSDLSDQTYGACGFLVAAGEYVRENHPKPFEDRKTMTTSKKGCSTASISTASCCASAR